MKNKIVKKIFRSPWFIPITATVIGSVLVQLFSKFKILTIILKLFINIKNLIFKFFSISISIPAWILLVIVIFIYLVVLIVIRHIRNIEKKIGGLKKTSSEPEPNEEILFVLKTLAGNASRYTERGGLNVVYEKTFEGKNQADFNVALAMLDTYGQIKISRATYGDEIIHITNNGLLYYDKHKKRLQKPLMQCPECGTWIVKGIKRCRKCGELVS